MIFELDKNIIKVFEKKFHSNIGKKWCFFWEKLAYN